MSLFDLSKDLGERNDLAASNTAVVRRLVQQLQAWEKDVDAEAKAGIKLTESFAMWPGSSVSGLYFSHPDSRYFGVGKIERDQVADYARRKGWDLATAERWLAPLLNYNPREESAA